jgi:hypothetical protein
VVKIRRLPARNERGRPLAAVAAWKLAIARTAYRNDFTGAYVSAIGIAFQQSDKDRHCDRGSRCALSSLSTLPLNCRAVIEN